MNRVVGVFALVLCACLAAGCGGSSLQAKARKFLRDPRATVTRFETVRIENGTRWTMTLVKGSRAHRLGCVHPGGSTQSACPRSRYALLGFSATTHALGLYWSTSPAQVAAIARARRASPRLRIFPDLAPLTVRCAIPRSSPPGGTVAGYCSTDAVPNDHAMRVNFVASWPLNPGRRGKVAEWIVMVSRDGRVQSIRGNHTARELWK